MRLFRPADPWRYLLVYLWLCLLPLVLLPRTADGAGEVSGRIAGFVVVDATGDGLSGVKLTIRSPDLIGGAQEKVTSDDGSYIFQNLPPGTYELAADIEGFARVLQRGIKVSAGQQSPVDVRLQIQSTPQENQTYQIIEKTNPVLNPESAAAVTTVRNEQVTRAPNFRQDKGIAQFAPGVTQGTDRVSVRGGLGRWNRFLIDGLEVTDITQGAFGSSSALVNNDAVEEHDVYVGAMDAEYNSLGLVQNIITRSGGNKFTVDFSFIPQPTFVSATTRYPARGPLQNTDLLYDDRAQPQRAFYSTNLNIGGPIVKDRLWFFTSFQFNYNRITDSTPEQPFYPGLSRPYDRYVDQTLYLGRAKLTWQVTASTRLSISYNLDRNYIGNAAASSALNIDPNVLAPEAERYVARGGDTLALNWDTALLPKLLFQLQTGVNFKRYLEDSQRVLDGTSDRVTPSHTLNTADNSNGVQYVNGARDWNVENKLSVQFAPSLLYTALGWKGTHNIKGGLQLAYMRYDHNVGAAGGRKYTDTVPGLPCDPQDPRTFASCSQVEEFPDSLPKNGQAGPGFSTQAQAVNIGFYLQDRYTLLRWLSIVPGMRVDVGLLYNGEGQKLATLVGFGPRLSVIYDLLHDRSTLIEAHYGRHNDVSNAFIADRGNPGEPSILKRWDPVAQAFPQDGRHSGGPTGQLFDANVTPPKVDEVGAGIHREVIPEFVAGVDYTYRKYQNLWINQEVNQIWDPQGTRVVGYVDGRRERVFQATTPDDAQRTYHGLDLWVRGTPGHFNVIASYTLAFASGTVQEYFEANGYKYNPRQNNLFDGPLPDNYRHYLKALLDYYFSFGLDIGVRFQYLSGSPQWKVFRSPEDQSYGLYRSPRGTDTGTRVNDPTTWATFQLPDNVNVDLQLGYNLEKLTGQKIDLIAMMFNVLNLGTPTALDTRDGPTFGQATRRPSNFFVEFVLRYRY